MNLNLKHKPMKVLEDQIGENLHDLWLGEWFVDMTAKAWFTKIKNKNNMQTSRKFSFAP